MALTTSARSLPRMLKDPHWFTLAGFRPWPRGAPAPLSSTPLHCRIGCALRHLKTPKSVFRQLEKELRGQLCIALYPVLRGSHPRFFQVLQHLALRKGRKRRRFMPGRQIARGAIGCLRTEIAQPIPLRWKQNIHLSPTLALGDGLRVGRAALNE